MQGKVTPPPSRLGLGVDWPHRQLVDIGNRVVCARVLGHGPTIVLEAGELGEGTRGAFGGLEERLAAFATVLTYDRAGSGRSDGPLHRSVAEMADDLDVVIRSLGCAAPVVLVGWSTGGPVAEMFAVRHPDKVAGLVLLDPTEPLTESRIAQYLLRPVVGTVKLVLELALQLGPTRARRSLIRRMPPAGISSEGLEYLDHLALNPPWAGRLSPRLLPLFFGRYAHETAAAVRAASLPDVPVLVLVPRLRGGVPRAYAQRLAAAHRALAERFPQGKLVVVDRTSHLLPIDRPDAVIAAVRDVLALDATMP
jgi:pimeloyl-ACP methyl ester carboxylesterase